MDENQLKVITKSVRNHGKLRTEQGLMINQIVRVMSHTNFCIAAKLLVDQNAHCPNAPIILEEREWVLQYFFSHQYDEQWPMLAGHGRSIKIQRSWCI